MSVIWRGGAIDRGTRRWLDLGWAVRISGRVLHVDAGTEGRIDAPLWKFEKMLIGLGLLCNAQPSAFDANSTPAVLSLSYRDTIPRKVREDSE